MSLEPVVFHEGRWLTGNPPILGPMDQSFFLGSMVFDGGRCFDDVAPDLDLHCERAVESARRMGLAPAETAEQVLEIALDACGRFPAGTPLYVRPTFYATDGFLFPEPEGTRFMLVAHHAPLPEPNGFVTGRSNFRRPAPDQAPTDAKAACLYPNVGRAIREAMTRGIDIPVMLGPDGKVAEFASSNLFFAHDGVAVTPAANGCFLAGITRRRTIDLLRDAGVTVEEREVDYDELLQADEIFSTGNYGKVIPVSRIDQRDLQPGPIYHRARDAYFAFAHDQPFRIRR